MAGPQADVVVSSTEGLAQTIVAGKHQFRADEPAGAGGADSGPTPYDLLLAALGACKSITLRMYAQRKGWPLEGVEVALRHDRVHAQDCADSEQRGAMIDRIRVQLTLSGPLDDAQRERLHEIADRCPVHRTLTGEIRIETRLSPAAVLSAYGERST